MTKNLAINGGPCLAQYEEWPRWPIYNKSFETSLKAVLKSHRWTISGFYTGDITFDERFCEIFSKYHNTRYALTVDHGTSAILIALQALGVSYGDEVILPALTWVACASVILRVNAKPVFVDVEENTLCIDPQKVEEAINAKTRAILVVHLYCCMANMDALKQISKKYSIPLIEDCSQAHGAMWNEQKAGSIGDVGIFSMQQGKPLTCGEGGAAITNDEYLYRKMFMLKNDGRSFQKIQPGYQQLKEEGEIIGSNLALSEFQCAVLCEGFKLLENILVTQRKNADFLAAALSHVPELSFLTPHLNNTAQTYYHFVVKCGENVFNNISTSTICEALSKELGFWIHPIYQPLYRHKLFQITKDGRFAHLLPANYPTMYLPVCELSAVKAIAIHHSMLLAPQNLLKKVAKAFKKVQQYAYELQP